MVPDITAVRNHAKYDFALSKDSWAYTPAAIRDTSVILIVRFKFAHLPGS